MVSFFYVNSEKSYIYKQALATAASSLISMCSGLTFGITAVMLPQLKENEFFQYDAANDSWIASISTLSMIIGSLFVGTIADWFGRKTAHIILGIPFMLGWVIIAFADSVTLILVGRFITGIAAAANKSVTMIYIGEIANPTIRVIGLCIPGVMAHVGIIFSHLVGHYFPWKTSALICIAPSAIASIAFFFLKESPLWLITKGRTQEGIAAFRWFRGTDDASEKELKSVSEQAKEPRTNVKEAVKTIFSASFIKPILILMLLMFEMQFSGINVLSFYAQEIFAQTFSKNVDPFTMMIATDLVRTVVSMGVCLFYKFSKKVIFLIASFGVSISLFGLIVWLMLAEKSEWIPVTCLIIYTCFSSMIVTVSWTFVPEVLPGNVRGFGSGVNAAFSYICLFVVVKITPDMMSYGEVAIYGLYAISTFICGMIAFFVLPETNGKTLQSIEDKYKKRKVDQNVLKT